MMISSGVNSRAMAIMARWRIPPVSWWGIAVQVDGVDAHHAQHLGRPARISALVIFAVRLHGVGELGADGLHGVEGVHGALHHHREVAPADVAQLLLLQLHHVLAREEHAAAR